MQNGEATQSQAQPSRRSSRYRSVRQTQAPQAAPHVYITPTISNPALLPNAASQQLLSTENGLSQWVPVQQYRSWPGGAVVLAERFEPRTESQMPSSITTDQYVHGSAPWSQQRRQINVSRLNTSEHRQQKVRRTSREQSPDNVQGRGKSVAPVANASTFTREVGAEETSEQSVTVQRSMSRYRKDVRPRSKSAAPASTRLQGADEPPVPVMSNQTMRDFRREKICLGPHEPQDLQLVTRDMIPNGQRRDGTGREPSGGVPSAERAMGHVGSLPKNSPVPNGTSITFDSSPINIGNPLAINRNKSRSHQASMQRERDIGHTVQAQRGLAEHPTVLPRQTKHEHQEALPRLQKQLSSPSLLRPMPHHLTKEFLEQLPDDTETKAKALVRRQTLIKQKSGERRRIEKREVEMASNAARQLLEAEAERQRRMQTKIKAEKDMAEKVKAEEDAIVRRRWEEREELRRREKGKKQVESDARSKAMRIEQNSQARTAQGSSSILETYQKPLLHRIESPVKRVQRHRKRSLSKLEGKPLGLEEDARETPSPPPIPPTPPPFPSHVQVPEHTEARAPFGFLRKKRQIEMSRPEERATRSKNNQRRASDKAEPLIKQGGGGTAPAVDAPTSAINYGERRVLIECNKSSISLPITPTSTPIDLIRTAANVMNEPINARASVLLESFEKVGVQRPLRNYEHVRDVMNSWDDDQQNSLVLMPSATDGNDLDLAASSVSSIQPAEFSCYLHHSQKPGKWDKKWVTLRADGQMMWAKNESHKDTTNLCHMTDFDVYSPDLHTLTKTVKPPKKICFAVKSQQKSNMFLSLENFVHFFCTSDKQIAAAWYKAVQGWRSWYLVNVLGEGKKPGVEKDETTATGGLLLPEMAGTSGSRNSHYQLGSFQPLLDLGQFGLSLDSELDGATESSTGLVSHARGKSSRSNGPTLALPKWLIDNRSAVTDTRGQISTSPAQPGFLVSTSGNDDTTFAAGGLLGRSYSTRQKATQDREISAAAQNAFTGGLLGEIAPSGGINGFNTGVPQQYSHEGVRPSNSEPVRSASKHRPRNTIPLVDLTVTDAGTVQYMRKGRGFSHETPASGVLIDSVTSKGLGMGSEDVGGLMSRGSAALEDERQPSQFAADGLLAQSKGGWGGKSMGRGVLDGSKASGPMLNVTEMSKYTEGSLLRKVELQRPEIPVIDRTKGNEIVVGTGETF